MPSQTHSTSDIAAPWVSQTGLVALHAARIRFYGNCLVQAHVFGLPAGFDDEPWGRWYQRQAVKIDLEVLPEAYLQQLGSVFLGCVAVMDAQPDHPESLRADWKIVRSYFVRSTGAIEDLLGVRLQAQTEDPTNQEPVTPGVVRFDLLAGHVSPEGAQRLRTAGANIADFFGHHVGERTIDLRQLSLLKSLSIGTPVADVANAHGVSRRSCYREISGIVEQLGVPNRQQAAVFAAEQGWF